MVLLGVRQEGLGRLSLGGREAGDQHFWSAEYVWWVVTFMEGAVDPGPHLCPRGTFPNPGHLLCPRPLQGLSHPGQSPHVPCPGTACPTTSSRGHQPPWTSFQWAFSRPCPCVTCHHPCLPQEWPRALSPSPPGLVSPGLWVSDFSKDQNQQKHKEWNRNKQTKKLLKKLKTIKKKPIKN